MLLISPGILKWTDMDFGLPHLVALGGYLQAHADVRVELLDLNYEGGDHRQLARTLDDLGPFLLIGVSAYSSYDLRRVMALAAFLKRAHPTVPLVAGGYHASALPDDLVFPGSPFDAVVVGEGEAPLLDIVRTLQGGGRLDRDRFGPCNLPDLDQLPPYRWELLNRYWPRAHTIGKKLQIYLSRGCPYHCTFCMERAKTDYQWRPYSPERAVAELERLATFTDLSRWVVNLADPLFGFRRRWRREVLSGIIAKGLVPRQFWTLTRSDDLDAEDVSLLARARFSIGIGLETGSPRMLGVMDKTKDPARYLGALERLAGLSRQHGLNWAANVIVGHPGETRESIGESKAFLERLFTTAKDTCGWLSFDPFRLYPGALVHEELDRWSAEHGARFYHPRWWDSWYDASFRAEHLDPSSTLDYEGRVRAMYEAFGPLTEEIQRRFRGQGRSVDRVFERSLAEQRRQMSPEVRDQLLAKAARAKAELARRPAATPAAPAAPAELATPAPVLALPIGLHVRDERVRGREGAVRRLLEEGVLRTEALIEALLTVAPEPWLGDAGAAALLAERPAPAGPEGAPAPWLPVRVLAMALEALEPGTGDRVALLGETRGYVAALASALVGDAGEVCLVHPPLDKAATKALHKALAALPRVAAAPGDPTVGEGLTGRFDRLWVPGALPRFPAALRERLHDPGGRAVAFLGPRFRPQDLVCLVRSGDAVAERLVARLQVPVLAGRAGWLAA